MNVEGEDLLALLATDLDRYFERLVSIYWQQLRNFAFRQTNSLQDAEDIVQEAVVRAYLALERYSAQRIRTMKLRPWLYKITWNVYCNYTSRTKQPPYIPLDVTAEDDPLLEREDDQHEQPEIVLENAERKRELAVLVSALPRRVREVMNFYYFEELNTQEIADILNVPVATIRVYLHRGIHLLRMAVAVQESEGRNSGA